MNLLEYHQEHQMRCMQPSTHLLGIILLINREEPQKLSNTTCMLESSIYSQVPCITQEVQIKMQSNFVCILLYLAQMHNLTLNILQTFHVNCNLGHRKLYA